MVKKEFGAPDVVLDDGSHMMADMRASFDFLYPRMSKSGVYMVEDLHTAYWPEFQGGVGRKGNYWLMLATEGRRNGRAWSLLTRPVDLGDEVH